MSAEEWRQIPSFPDYLASNMGRVRRSRPSPHKAMKADAMSPCVDSKGFYNRVCLRKDGWSKAVTVHSVVAEAFIGPKPAGLMVNHKDGNKKNNRASNLEYVTNSENQRHAHRLGLSKPKRGDEHANAKLTENDVRKIMLLEGALKQTEIAKLFRVSKPTINRIFRGGMWCHITGRTEFRDKLSRKP